MTERRQVRMGLTNTRIMSGDEDLTKWDEEELLRGQRRDKRGGWGGRPPKVVPKAIHDELSQRTMSEAHELLRHNLVKAVQVLVDIAGDDTAEASVRVKAASLIMDRVLGRAPERVHIAVEPAWSVALRSAITATPDDHGVISIGVGNSTEEDR